MYAMYLMWMNVCNLSCVCYVTYICLFVLWLLVCVVFIRAVKFPTWGNKLSWSPGWKAWVVWPIHQPSPCTDCLTLFITSPDFHDTSIHSARGAPLEVTQKGIPTVQRHSFSREALTKPLYLTWWEWERAGTRHVCWTSRLLTMPFGFHMFWRKNMGRRWCLLKGVSCKTLYSISYGPWLSIGNFMVIRTVVDKCVILDQCWLEA